MTTRIRVRIIRATWKLDKVEHIMAGVHLIRAEFDACYETEGADIEEFDGWLEYEETA